MASEIELKLEIPPRDIRKLRRMRALRDGAAGRAREQDLVSIYYDTARHRLHKHGVSLRVRHDGDKRIQTVKANGQWAAGLAQRDEWERPIDHDMPDLRAARRTALGPLLDKKLAHGLKPVFETRVHRTVLPLNHGKSRIELTLDQGQVRAGRESALINEVELELKRGLAADLLGAARDLSRRVPARLAVRSKADRGYDLAGGHAISAERWRPITLAPDVTAGEAFRTISLACVHHIAANEPAVSAGDSEGVHQMRVGLRRLRAAIAVFSDMLADPQTASVKAELKWLTNELGPARDLDVYITSIRDSIKPVERELLPQPDAEMLQHALEAWRAEAFERARKAVGSAHYRALILDTLGWIVDGDWSRSDDELVRVRRERRAADFAAEELARRARKAGKRAQRLAKLDARRRHKLRIAAKKLRYASEFFRSFFAKRKARKRLRRYTRRLKALQDCLGALNDMTVHGKLAAAFVRERAQRRECAFAIGALSGDERCRTEPLREASIATARRLAHARPFWT